VGKFTFNNSVVIITGAAGGIGESIARSLDQKGARLALADINEPALMNLAGKLSTKPLIVKCDITNKADVDNLMTKTAAEYGRIDVLINNAGIIRPGNFENSSLGDIELQVSVNLMGAIYCTHAAIPYMKQAGKGNIVTISSLAGIVPETGSAVYSATKFALRGLNLTLRLELIKHNIFTSAIFPNSVNTPMLLYEANHNGSGLTFLDLPISPEEVAQAVIKAIVKRKAEVYVPQSQGILSKFVSCFPWLLEKLWPMFEIQGQKKKQQILKMLEEKKK
jgi:short-subunit dehydrogenase